MVNFQGVKQVQPVVPKDPDDLEDLQHRLELYRYSRRIEPPPLPLAMDPRLRPRAAQAGAGAEGYELLPAAQLPARAASQAAAGTGRIQAGPEVKQEVGPASKILVVLSYPLKMRAVTPLRWEECRSMQVSGSSTAPTQEASYRSGERAATADGAAARSLFQSCSEQLS